MRPFMSTVRFLSRIGIPGPVVRAYIRSSLSSSFSFFGGCEGKRGEIERPMRNVRRVHAPTGFGIYVHCHRRFSEVEHYKCTSGEPSRSTKIDLPDRVSREGQVHRAKRNRVRSLVRSLARVRIYAYQIWAVQPRWNCRTTEFYKH